MYSNWFIFVMFSSHESVFHSAEKGRWRMFGKNCKFWSGLLLHHFDNHTLIPRRCVLLHLVGLWNPCLSRYGYDGLSWWPIRRWPWPCRNCWGLFILLPFSSACFILEIKWVFISHWQDRQKRASACYAAAGIYCVTLALSGVCWCSEYFRFLRKTRRFDEIFAGGGRDVKESEDWFAAWR